MYRVGAVVNAARIDTVPAPDAICTLAIVTPAHLVAVPRTNQPVTVSVEIRQVP